MMRRKERRKRRRKREEERWVKGLGMIQARDMIMSQEMGRPGPYKSGEQTEGDRPELEKEVEEGKTKKGKSDQRQRATTGVAC
jgi:hypothetical protein